MQRREFLTDLALALIGGAAAWAWGRLSWPEPSLAASPELRLALLADAHLRDGNPARPEARALARAVAEIRRLGPVPDLVLFAGDLAHDGNPNALALGKEILGDLPAPLAAVMGEGDAAGKGSAFWPRLLGEPRFSRRYPGFQLLGINTYLAPSHQESAFEVGEEQRGWLAQELARLDPGRPLLILSHAPLARIFRPWQQWTGDAPEVMQLLTRFSQVYCFHGHIHRNGCLGENPATRPRIETPPPLVGGGWGEGESFTPTLTLPHQGGGNKKATGSTAVFHHGLPATAWSLPSPLQGTLPMPRPGLGSHGCGWGLVSLGDNSLQYQPQVWQV